MPLQAFVDESGGKGHSDHFFMASLLGHSQDWVHFSDEWRECLARAPAIRVFKMKEAAGCSGEFRGWGPMQRDAKLRELARIINRHAKWVTYCGLDLAAHAKTWATTCVKPLNDPYFFPFQITIMAICFHLWELGWREEFQIVFDEQRILGPRARGWYPIMREVVKLKDPESHAIMPTEPLFRPDDECPPLQAADLFAWCFRSGTSKGGADNGFEWLLDELRSVKLNPSSQFYDLE